ISTVGQQISPALEHVISRALVKDPGKRWQSAADIGAELEWAVGSAAALNKGAVSGVSVPGRPTKPYLLGALVAITVLALIALAFTLLRKPVASSRLVAAIPPPEDAPFQLVGDVGAPPVLSPDGQYFVFGASDRIWIRSLESGEGHPLEGTENG